MVARRQTESKETVTDDRDKMPIMCVLFSLCGFSLFRSSEMEIRSIPILWEMFGFQKSAQKSETIAHTKD
jgi:hypothetical protein